MNPGLLDQQTAKIMEYEKQIENMEGQIRENEAFKAVLAAREAKDRIRENDGVHS